MSAIPTPAPGAAAAPAPSVAQLQALFECSADLFCALEVPGFKVVSINPAVERLTGYSTEAMLGRCALDFVPPEDHAVVSRAIHEAMATREPREIEIGLIDNVGQLRRVVWRAIWGAGEGLAYGIGIDVTAARSEQRLRVEQARAALALDAAKLGLWDWDLTTNLLNANSADFELMGRTPADGPVDFEGLFANVDPRDLPGLRSGIARAIAQKTHFSREFRVNLRDSSVRWLRASGDVYCDAEGTPGRVVGVKRDITDRMLAEISLRESEQRFRSLAEAAPAIIWVSNPNGEVHYFNKAWADYAGPEAGAAPGNWLAYVHPEEQASNWQSHLDAVRNRTGRRAELRLRRADGVYRTFLANMSPRWSQDGSLLGFVGIAIDISENVRAHQALQGLAIATTNTGQAFFDALVQALCSTFGCCWAAVETIDFEVGRARTLSVWYNGRAVDNLEYELAGTPCERAARGESCYYRSGVQALFPDDAILAQMGIESYVAVPLKRANGDIFGLLVVMHTEPLDEAVEPEQVMRIFAERAAAEFERMATEQQLRRVTAELTLTEERERKNLARALHDNIVQDLALIKMKFTGLGRPRTQARIRAYEELRVLLDKTVQEARTLMFEISPPVLYDLGLNAAIEWLCERFSNDTRLPCDVDSDSTADALPMDTRIAVFQFVRELLVNVRKHAQASRARVSSRAGGGYVRFTVWDDGVGFDYASRAALSHQPKFGLFQICERVELLGGEFRIESTRESGTTVQISLPMPGYGTTS